MIDEELFYTGVVSELAQKSNLVRSGSVCTVSSETQEATLKQRVSAWNKKRRILIIQATATFAIGNCCWCTNEGGSQS